MRWLRWLGYALVVLLVIGAGAYYWLIVDSSGPSGDARYEIDMAEVRRLASSLQGDKPTEIRFEHVASFKFPFTAAVAGESWEMLDVPVFSYQVVYPTGTLIIDTGVDGAQAAKDENVTFYPEPYARMQKAMETTSWIVITHEHPDHIGGLVAHPNIALVMTRAKLTREQIEHPEKMFGLKWPPGVIDNQERIDYDRYLAVAPGVVLVKAPGHTPGSQMVFVQRADGKEMLFLGDVAWRFESVERVRTRARLVSQFMLGEDRDAVMRELVELHRIHEAEPSLTMVAGHDAKHHAETVQQGLLIEGFK